MFLRKRLVRSGGASLCALRASQRSVGSSSSNGNNRTPHGTGESNERADNVASGQEKNERAAPASTTTRSVSPGFQGWRRFDLPRSDDAAPVSSTVPPTQDATTGAVAAAGLSPLPAAAASAHAVVDQKKESSDARRRAASARLADMFVESGRHTEWMQQQRQRSAQATHYEEGATPVRRDVHRPSVGDRNAVAGDGAAPSPLASRQSAAQTAMSRRYTYDEDNDAAFNGAAAAAVDALAPVTPTEVLEQELLDDNFFYYPAPAPVHGDGVKKEEDGESRTFPRAAAKRYVPGQQIIPPGFTRYRVDVQYQGSDFDGWYKSVQRTRPSAASSAAATTHDLTEGSSRHFARTVLEEALAVALDVANVSVVAAAIPESGVSVRRLTCHVDVPSDIELQPRTILQRATLWLHQRKQPLAILSCHPCANQDFHARHSGVRRVYCYRILNRIAPPLFDAGLQWHVDRFLDVPRMQRMAAVMEGTHDYGFFADPKMANALRRAAAHAGGGGGQVVTAAYSPEHEPLQSHGLPAGQTPAAPKVTYDRGLSQLERASALPTFNEYGQRVVTYQAKPREYLKAHTNLPTVRTIDKIEVVRQEDEVLIWFVGQSFLRHQIRNMVSVLKAGGHGLWDDQELQHAFQAGFEVSRKKFARERLPPAPVHGLTLWDVEYPAQHTSDFVSYVDAGPYEPFDVSAHH